MTVLDATVRLFAITCEPEQQAAELVSFDPDLRRFAGMRRGRPGEAVAS